MPKEPYLNAGAQPELFGVRGGFVELGHLINISSKPQAKHYTQLHNYILNGKFNLKMDTITAVFSKKKQGRSALSPPPP